jgi:hypothetical protein
VTGLDAMALAIFAYESGYLKNPKARPLQNLNPGDLRSPDWPNHDADGFDIYGDFISGYESLWDDLCDKFQTGKNAHGLGPQSTLLDLFNVYAPGEDGNDPNSYCVFVAGWLNQALGRPIAVTTLLGDIWKP